MADLMEAVTSLAKRRGIAFQSSEIYERAPLVMGLRAPRYRDQAQRPRAVVALNRPAPRRRGRPRGRRG